MCAGCVEELDVVVRAVTRVPGVSLLLTGVRLPGREAGEWHCPQRELERWRRE